MHMSYMYVQPAIGFETLNAIARARINDGVKKVYIYIYIYMNGMRFDRQTLVTDCDYKELCVIKWILDEVKMY